jgi:pyruvate,water dikinase
MTAPTQDLVLWFDQLGSDDLSRVGGKNSALGELIRELAAAGVSVPNGFATTAHAYREFLDHNKLIPPITEALAGLDPTDVVQLEAQARKVRELILAASLPPALVAEVRTAYATLCTQAGTVNVPTAVRSSATAEDLPTASFAGQQETFLYVTGIDDVLQAVVRCFASLFTARAISYRAEQGFGNLDVALSVGVQLMVRSDVGASGVLFTLEPDSGHTGFVYLTSSWGLGETVVQGRVMPDAFLVHKHTLEKGAAPIVRRQLGTKRVELVRNAAGHPEERAVEPARSALWSLTDEEVLQLARWALKIEQHFTARRGAPVPMDIEWAKDGVTGALFIVQARPETVHAQQTSATLRRWTLQTKVAPLVEGLAVGSAVAAGKVRVVRHIDQMSEVQDGDVLVASSTDPDWEPVMKRCSAMITEHGGRTSHAAIVSREHGLPAVVGAEGAMDLLAGQDEVTVSCAEGATGRVYPGRLPFTFEDLALERVGKLRTKVLLNVGDPDAALELARLPVDGVGLARMEFILSSWIGVHPHAVLNPETLSPEDAALLATRTGGEAPAAWYVSHLAEGLATLAAAFWPRSVLLRFSDFKTNEYATLLGGHDFEPHEENPMIGWRGASRYHDPRFREAFLLEVAAVRRVREQMGLDNLNVMVPFCRSPAEGQQVLDVMAEGGLVRGAGGLQVWVMAEIPSNILLAEDFAALFDGFSIGSNDLTQLLYGVDRDSTEVAALFDDDGPALRRAIAMLLEAAQRTHTPVGICGEAPSNHPELAAFLVEHGISSVSLAPDAIVRGLTVIAEAERQLTAPSSDHAP